MPLTRPHYTLSTIFLLLPLVVIHAQEPSACEKKIGVVSTCVSIYECTPLLSKLKDSRTLTDELRRLFIQAKCDQKGRIPFVCCPSTQARRTEIIEVPLSEDDSEEEYGDKPNTSYKHLTNLPEVCGQTNLSLPRVVGGIPARLGDFPWMVALGYRNMKNPNRAKWLCGGTFITHLHILTAGHCVHERNDLYLVRVSDLDLYNDTDGAHSEDIPIAEVILHENYNKHRHTYDIAIVKLARPPKKQIMPICMPTTQKLLTKNFERHHGLVAGWGALYFNGPSSSHLQMVSLPITNQAHCKEKFGKLAVIDSNIICAGYLSGGKDACQGDSGGPLMYGDRVNNDVQFYQLGVVSYGFRCAEVGYPGVYTRVTAFVDWIKNNLV